MGSEVRLSPEIAALPLPDSLSVEESFRAAFYLVEAYFAIESTPDESLVDLLQYMRSDPARWSDWQKAVRRAVSDEGAASRGLTDERWGAEL
jgi:hypothetical protein